MNTTSFSQQTFSKKVIVHLIREELKSRKFFEGLREIGLDDNFYQIDLMELIMAGVGLPADCPEHYNFCYQLLHSHSTRVVEDADELLNEANRVYKFFRGRQNNARPRAA